MTQQRENRKKLTVQQMAVTAVMTAVTCVLAPLAFPIGPVPISLGTFAIYLSVYVLDLKQASVSYLIYLLIGLAGVPVFSGFGSGPGRLLGPTGGYLIGFLPLLMIAGIFIDRWADKRLLCAIGLVLGTAVCYAFGTAWLAYQAAMNIPAALMNGVIPFLPGDMMKICIILLIGPVIRRQLRNAVMR